jgi:hypothetical protein
MNQFFRATIDAKDGDATALGYFACNLLARVMPGGDPSQSWISFGMS